MSGYDVTCRHLIEFLRHYLDGELPDAERTDFEEHLRLCPPCRNYLETYEETIRLGKEAFGGDELPEEIPEALVRAVLAVRPRKD